MAIDPEDLFRQLAEDEGIQQAIAEHEAACTPRQGECVICKFFNAVHELRHFSEVFDSEKILGLASDVPQFLSDSMAVVGFLSETAKIFLDNLEFFAIEEGEFEEEDEDGLEEDGDE